VRTDLDAMVKDVQRKQFGWWLVAERYIEVTRIHEPHASARSPRPVSPGDASLTRAVDYLLGSQRADGSW
jgi:hypothetical protein